jgi:hypothetical protein
MRRCAIACQLGVLDPRSPITEEGSTGGGLSARMIGPEKPGNSGVFRGRLCTLAGAGSSKSLSLTSGFLWRLLYSAFRTWSLAWLEIQRSPPMVGWS